MGGAVPKRWRPIWCLYASGPRIYVAFLASSSLVAIPGSQELGRSTALLRLHAWVRFLVYFG